VSRRIAFLLPLLALVARCGNNIPFQYEPQLVRPTGLIVTALSGQQMEVQYAVQNQELTFDGYNLVISRMSIGDGEAQQMTPLTINGSVPTFLQNSTQYDPNIMVTQVISRFTNTFPFEVGTTYYFRLLAHSRKGVLSLPSNQVLATGQL